MSRLVILLLALPLVVAVAGCGDTPSVEGHQERVIEQADPDAVLLAAATILKREFGRVQMNREARQLSTAPVEYTTQRESGTARDLYRGTSTMRRKADFQVGRRSGMTVARLRVDVERRDTERQVLMRPRGQRLGDTPGQETAIEADAATTGEQNAVWTKVRRDRTLERALLDELREHFARLSAESEAAVSVAPAQEQEAQPQPDAQSHP